MKKAMTSMAVLGIGAAAYTMAQKNHLMSGRQMRKMARKVKRAMF
ncbi:YrzQ family protein [Neobacillus dielmonensis]|nr:YrzQ family protein [Neobacillus dielmonensis]